MTTAQTIYYLLFLTLVKVIKHFSYTFSKTKITFFHTRTVFFKTKKKMPKINHEIIKFFQKPYFTIFVFTALDMFLFFFLARKLLWRQRVRWMRRHWSLAREQLKAAETKLKLVYMTLRSYLCILNVFLYSLWMLLANILLDYTVFTS